MNHTSSIHKALPGRSVTPGPPLTRTWEKDDPDSTGADAEMNTPDTAPLVEAPGGSENSYLGVYKENRMAAMGPESALR